MKFSIRSIVLAIGFSAWAAAQVAPTPTPPALHVLALDYPDSNPAGSVTYHAQISVDGGATYTDIPVILSILAVAEGGTVAAGPNQLNISLLTGNQPASKNLYRVYDVALPGAVNFQGKPMAGQSLFSNVVAWDFTQPSPTPIVTASPTPSPSPTATPSPTPSPSPTSTPSPTATPVAPVPIIPGTLKPVLRSN